MSDADALLDAIFNHPADDTPRLVYADFLQEHGQEAYAEFVRLQCAAARCRVWSDEANELWVKIGHVWNRLSDEWRPATAEFWPGIPGNDRYRQAHGLDAVHFHRGFLRDSIALTFDQLVRYADTCWPWLPLPVTHVGADPEEHDAPGFHRLSRIRHLCLRAGWEDGSGFWNLLNSPSLSNLEVLEVTAGWVGYRDAECLLKPGWHPKLRDVQLVVYDEDPVTNAGDGTDLSEPIPSAAFRGLRARLEVRFGKVSIQPGIPIPF